MSPQNAAEAVVVEYDAIDPAIGAASALAPDATQLWPEAPGNLAIDWGFPRSENDANARAVEQAIKDAPHVARVSYVNQRVVVASIEPRGATAIYDPAHDRYTLRVCSSLPLCGKAWPASWASTAAGCASSPRMSAAHSE